MHSGRKRLYGSTEQVIHHARTDTQRQAARCGSACRCVVLNEKLLEVMGDDVTQEPAFAHANDVLKNAVGGISDIIHIPGLVNVDFEDVKTMLGEPGLGVIGTAVAGGPDRANKAADMAVACPLLEGIDLTSVAPTSWPCIAATKSSMVAISSCSLMFIPACAVRRARPSSRCGPPAPMQKNCAPICFACVRSLPLKRGPAVG